MRDFLAGCMILVGAIIVLVAFVRLNLILSLGWLLVMVGLVLSDWDIDVER